MTATLCIALFALAQPPAVEPAKAWEGSVENAALQKIAPPVLTTAEGFGILWKAWGVPGGVPDVDFDDDFVVVTTGTGSVLKTKYLLADTGEMTVVAAATRDLKPGFRYNLAVLPRTGVAKVNGVPLKAATAEEPPAPTAVRYKPASALEGKLTVSGSVTMSHLAALWAEAFGKHHPKLATAVNAEGTEDALADLGATKPGETTVVAVSRPVPAAELAALSKKFGKTVLAFPVCEDEVAVIVHPTNPVAKLSPEQLKSVYTTPAGDLTWGKLGLAGKWAEKKVTLHGRDANSGTRKYLRTLAVGEDGAEPAATAHASYRKLIDAVAKDPAAIGYARGHNHGDTVKAVPIGPLKDGGTKPYIRRPCFVLVATQNEKELPPAVKEFLLFAYRYDGQSLLVRDGFEPLPKDAAAAALLRLGVDDTK